MTSLHLWVGEENKTSSPPLVLHYGLWFSCGFESINLRSTSFTEYCTQVTFDYNKEEQNPLTWNSSIYVWTVFLKRITGNHLPKPTPISTQHTLVCPSFPSIWLSPDFLVIRPPRTLNLIKIQLVLLPFLHHGPFLMSKCLDLSTSTSETVCADFRTLFHRVSPERHWAAGEREASVPEACCNSKMSLKSFFVVEKSHQGCI